MPALQAFFVEKMNGRGLTYAQKPEHHAAVTSCCKAAYRHRLNTRKLLISLKLIACSEDGQSGERLDFSGFAGIQSRFSTKLSTVFLEDFQSSVKSST
jgi:hypothetical protein